MQVLVINSGSSSIKFRLVEVVEEARGALASQPALLQGAIKGIGGVASFEVTGQDAHRSTTKLEIRNHAHALRLLFDRLSGSLEKIEAVGHRVVHGGDQYMEPTLITKEVEAGIDALSELAPLHNPSGLAGIRGAREVLGSRGPMVGVVYTAFQQSMPQGGKRYCRPPEHDDRGRARR